MEPEQDEGMARHRNVARIYATTIALIYLVVGFAWIAGSDWLAAAVAPDAETLARLQTAKGWLFVALMAVLIYYLVQRLYTHMLDGRALEKRVYHDTLTGLANRKLFMLKLADFEARSARTGDPFALMIIDVRGMRRINDSLGADAGDTVIRTVAQRVKPVFGDDDQLARIGGDTFAVLFAPPVSGKRIGTRAEALLAALELPIPAGGHEVRVSADMGVCFHPEDGKSGRALLNHAEHALHQAKRSEPGTLEFYSARMSESAYRVINVESALRRALETESLALHYQPRVDLSNGEVVSVEALLRWHDDELGQVSPAEFVPLAEEAGLVTELSRFVLDRACTDLAAWRAAGHDDLAVSVNLSAEDLRQSSLRQFIVDALDCHGAPARSLEVELTETIAMADPDRSSRILNDIKQLGIRIALDDFGTGYSSLAYLQQLPFDVIKIDRGFVRGLPDHRRNASICRTILGIARGLDMLVVAEGIETEQERRTLLDYGCQFGQGFLMYKPMPVERLLETLDALRHTTADRTGTVTPFKPR